MFKEVNNDWNFYPLNEFVYELNNQLNLEFSGRSIIKLKPNLLKNKELNMSAK